MNQEKPGWSEQLKLFLKPSVVRMLFLGFSAGMPLLLIFSSLSLWLREAGIDRSAVTFFSWAALGYSFKFVWSPLVDRLPLPILTKLLGRRRSWLLLSQVMIVSSIVWMALTDPTKSDFSLQVMAVAAVLLGFSGATQDIVIDAFRIESDVPEMQATMSATYIAGYRIGMIVSGAGALFLASLLGSTKDIYNYGAWKWTYIIMAMTMLVGILTTIFSPEPKANAKFNTNYSTTDYSRFLALFFCSVSTFVGMFFLSADIVSTSKNFFAFYLGSGLSAFIIEGLRFFIAVLGAISMAILLQKLKLVNRQMLEETYIGPVKDFFQRYGLSAALLLLSLVGLYRISDIVLGVISNVFYQDLDFTKTQIASVVKTYGVIMTLVGGFLGGILTNRYGVMRILFLGAFLSAITNLLFMALAYMGYNLPMLYVVISADNLAAGLASAAFVAFLSSLVNIQFTATQYAIFSSLMTLLPKVLGGYSGSMVDTIGYPMFFLFTTLIGVPVMFLVYLAAKVMKLNK